MAKIKSRYFTFLIYPESAPHDWIDKLESLGLPIAISPLHNKDKIEKKDEHQLFGEFKKAHYHCIYVANNPVTSDSVRNKLKRVLDNNTVSIVKVIDNVENMYLYLTHESKDAIKKNKTIYSKQDIIHLNNFDISRYITLSLEDKKDMQNKLINFIRFNYVENIIELYEAFDENKNLFLSMGFNSQDDITEIVSQKAGLFRLFFDGAYQISKKKKREL